jgi:hypothetical protein
MKIDSPMRTMGQFYLRGQSSSEMVLEMNIMSETLYTVYLARQGETEWSISGQHTGLADLPLTERGRRNATRLGERPKGLTFAKIFTSPLQRTTTCELAAWRNGPIGSRPGRMGLQPIRGPAHERDPAGASRRAIVPQRMSGGESPSETGARADRLGAG